MYSERKKSLINFILAVVTILFVLFLWRNTIVLVFLLSIISLLMLAVERNRAAFYLYIIAFVLGPLSESLAIQYGIWSYKNYNVLGFPAWLPFVWGNAALFLTRAHALLKHKLYNER
ncbi:MAG: hypothetical protein WC817_01600 [Patescibacteria group bacterium]|jgi:hypothetical protein